MQHGVPKGVANDHRPLAQALGPRGADIVVAQDLEEGGPRHAGGDGGVAIAHAHHRPYHLLEVRPRIDPRRRVLEGRPPAEVDDEEQDDQDADPEGGDGEAADADHADQVVDPRVLACRRDHAERNGEEHGHDGGEDGQLEAQGQPAEQFLEHGTARPQRVAEVEAHHAPQPVAELGQQRLVQPELVVHGRELRLVDVPRLVAAQDEQGHVPRDDPHNHEHHGGHPEQSGDDQEEPLGEIGGHAGRAQSSESQTSWSFWFE